MKLKIGDKLPGSELFYLDPNNDVKKINILDLCKGKTIILGMPGAFTKTCSALHLHGYIKNYEIAIKKGMPGGPLAVHDEVSLTLSAHVFESDPSEKKDSEKRTYDLVKKLINKHNRTGKRDGAGFYDYPKGEQKRLWKGLKEVFKQKKDAFAENMISKRLLHRQSLESFRCLTEGVLRSTTDGDIGSVLGWGFPIYTGGALSYIDYVGMGNFIKDCDEFKSKFGEINFSPKNFDSKATL